jgi:hypothetical protein
MIENPRVVASRRFDSLADVHQRRLNDPDPPRMVGYAR